MRSAAPTGPERYVRPVGAENVSREIVENTLSAGFDSLDVKLARIGYTPKALAERFDAHPGGPAFP